MKRTTGLVLLVVAIACSKDKGDRPLQYGAPQPATYAEQGAASTAQTTLAGSLGFSPGTDPGTGTAGLADQLAAALGGGVVADAGGRTALTVASPRTAPSTAIDTTGIDPACVTVTATSATWSGCVVHASDVDPNTGDSMDMTVTVDGTMSWNAATGQTTWNIDETMELTMTQSGSTITSNATAALEGDVTVTASTIVGQSSSDVTATAVYMGIPVTEGIRTTLALDLGYQPDPFCITSGTLTLEQRWTQRPAGTTEAMLPDQGWRFDWTGCGSYTVAHGS